MTDPRIDDYINKAQPFAQPILNHIRKLVHEACPEVTETIKWGMPFFEYKGPLCNIASFKAHCAFGFWQGSHMANVAKERKVEEQAMGNLGRITKLEDLPDDRVMIKLIQDALKLKDQGQNIPKNVKVAKPVEVPDYFLQALKKNKKAEENFNNFSPSHKKEYVEWITSAKTETTRNRRMELALKQIAEGKPKEWKYMK